MDMDIYETGGDGHPFGIEDGRSVLPEVFPDCSNFAVPDSEISFDRSFPVSNVDDTVLYYGVKVVFDFDTAPTDSRKTEKSSSEC